MSAIRRNNVTVCGSAPDEVGRYMHQRLAGSRFVQLDATGHYPNLSAPEETVAAISSYLSE
jgi:sigma-B regulation protein RsbQ